MEPLIWSAIIGALASLIGTGVNYFSQKKTNEENKEYATQMTNAQWERDDSSLQRQVEDAQKAGLSPLAVTGAMNTSSPLNYVAQAPQMDFSSLLGLSSSFMSNSTTQHEGEENRKQSSENLDKQLTYNLNALEKQLKADQDLQNNEFAHNLVTLGKQLTYQYDVLNEQSQAHAQDLERDRLIQLSDQSMQTYSEITFSLGMAPQTQYVSDLKEYQDMYNSFMRKYNNFLQDWKDIDIGTVSQEQGSEGMNASALKTGVSFTTSSGKTYDSKSALLHDMFAEYMVGAVLPIFIDSEKWTSRTYSYTKEGE